MARYLNNFANKRDKNEPEIVEAFKVLGCSVYRLNKPVDLLIALKCGKLLLVEVKTDKGTLTSDQVRFINKWPSPVHVVRNITDVLNLVNSIT